MNMFSNSVDAIECFGVTENNNFFFDDYTDAMAMDDEGKEHLKHVASSLFKVALKLSKELNLDCSKSYVNFNRDWKKVTIYNDNDDSIIAYVTDDLCNIDRLEIHSNDNGLVAVQALVIVDNASFNGKVIKGCDMFKMGY